MARRVNTRFVVFLCLGLCLIIAMVGGIIMYTRHIDRDPVRNMAKADEAEKAGRMREALRFYEKASTQLNKTRSPGADELCTKIGDMALALSATDDVDALEAEALYNRAMHYWNLALQQNARHLPAIEKLVEEYYKNAMFYRHLTHWTQLAQEAKNLTDLNPDHQNGHTYLATAKLNLAMLSSSKQQFDPAVLEEVEELIKKAMEHDPTSRPVVLQSQLLGLKAVFATQGSLARQAKEYSDASMNVLVECLKKFPNDTDATELLAMTLMRQRQNAEAIKLLVDTLAVNPDDSRLGELLSRFYAAMNQGVKAEETLKRVVAANPKDPDSHMRLGMFYQGQQKINEAIEAFKQVLANPAQGGGILVVQNRMRENTATFGIAWLYMDAAERAEGGVNGTRGTEFMAMSEQYVGRLRSNARTDRNMLELLDGRTQFMKNNIDEAIRYLKRANAWYESRPLSLEWRYTKSLLAMAFNKKREWGLEQFYLDEYLNQYPRQASFLLRKGRSLVQVAEFDKALATVDGLMKGSEFHPPEIVTEAKKVAAVAHRGLGNIKMYEELMEQIIRESNNASAGIALANNFMASGDLDRAMEEINKVLVQFPDDERALMLGVMIHLRQEGPDHKAAATTLLDRGLAKYPNNAQFQFLKGRMESSETDPSQIQEKAASVIEDDYARNIYLAQVFMARPDRLKALDSFSKAAAALEQSGSPEEIRDKMASLNDQAFALSLSTAAEGRRVVDMAQRANFNAVDDAAKEAVQAEKTRGEALIKKGMEQAQLYAQKAERLNLDGVNGRIYQGRLLFMNPATRSQGLTLLEQAVQSQPDNTVAHTVLGGAYVDVGRLDEALNEFQTAINQKPDNLFALISAIDLLIRKGERNRNDEASYERARKYLRDAMQFSPKNPQLKRFNDLIGDVTAGIRSREEIRQRNPDDDDNTFRLAGLYDRRARAVGATNHQADTAKAIELLKLLFDKRKNSLLVGNHLARLYNDLKQPENGKTVYETLLMNDDLLLRYDTLLAYGDYSASLQLYSNALSLYREAAANEPPGREGAMARIADLLFDLDDMSGAEVAYRQFFERNRDPRAQRRLVQVFINLRKFDLAQAQIDDILKIYPKDLDARILSAYSLVVQAKFAQGIEAFNVILKEHPGNFDAMYYRALAHYINRSDLRQATDDLLTIRSRGLELRSSNRAMLLVNSRLLLARVHRLAGRYAESADEYMDIINTLADRSPMPRIEYARFLLMLADVFYRIQPENTSSFAQDIRVARPVERMIALLQDSKEKIPGQPMWFALEGQLRSLDPRQAAAAQQCFLEAFKLSRDPEIATLYLNSLLETRNYPEAVKVASMLIANPPRGSAPYGEYFVKRGIAYAGDDKPAESLADFKQALAMASQSLNLHMNVSRQAIAVLRDTMVAELQARVAAKPDDYFAIVVLAEYSLGSGKFDEAIKLLAPLPAKITAQGDRDLVLRTLAAAKYHVKDFAGASKDYRELLKISTDDMNGYRAVQSDDIQALNNFAFMLAEDLKRPEEALILAEKAMNILKSGSIDVAFVNNGNIYDTYGWIKFLNGDIEDAIFQLRQAVQIESFPTGYLHLGIALAKDNQRQAARQALETGIKLAKERRDPTLKELEAALAEVNK
ncbi:MAG: tetratricopeptide repeat protein [Phycisphaerales bacterium]|nr:tetratricopeptide repeat protein [Phycisphaerales bacterium]